MKTFFKAFQLRDRALASVKDGMDRRLGMDGNVNGVDCDCSVFSISSGFQK